MCMYANAVFAFCVDVMGLMSDVLMQLKLCSS